MTRKFEWDHRKSASNLKKHGISFEEAVEIFHGPILSHRDDRDYGDEIHELSFGLIAGVIVVAVSHTDRHGRIRIISARKATKTERRKFHVYLEKALG